MSRSSRRGLQIVAIDPGTEQFDRFRRWYEYESAPGILSVGGVADGGRWDAIERRVPGENNRLVSVPAFPAYIAIYELDDVDITRSEPFLEAAGRSFDEDVVHDDAPLKFERLFSVTLREISRRENPGMESSPASGMLVVSLTPQRDHTQLFHEWYETEHLDEMLECPGFLRARRYIALEGIPNFFAFYDLETVEALKTEEFLRLSARPFDQSPPIEQQVGPHMTGNILDVYRILD